MLVGASQMAVVGKDPPAIQEMQEMQVWFLGWEDLLEMKLVTYCERLHSS